ncbi:YqaA family protein [Glaesserella sp.]|uniref:YqaA family protein n=1 Tax=Glaesserella sp. TaxID=2094731 RepID=UPI0035A08493
MTNYFTSLMSFFSSIENPLTLMFISAFLSATLLPGNSEIIFSALISQALQIENGSFYHQIIPLFISATLGNSLGSLTTYAVARLVPQPQFEKTPNKTARWALYHSKKYGIWILLFSWLPIVGDLFCGIAGWLRFNVWYSLIFITLGKAIRYVVLLWGIYSLLG